MLTKQKVRGHGLQELIWVNSDGRDEVGKITSNYLFLPLKNNEFGNWSNFRKSDYRFFCSEKPLPPQDTHHMCTYVLFMAVHLSVFHNTLHLKDSLKIKFNYLLHTLLIIFEAP